MANSRCSFIAYKIIEEKLFGRGIWLWTEHYLDCKKIKYLTSFEADNYWYEKVEGLIKEHNLSNKVNYLKCSSPIEYRKKISKFKNNSLDFCLVDGDHRDLCALNILPKLKPGSLLVIDNANWYLPSNSKSPASIKEGDNYPSLFWKKFHDKVKNYRVVHTSNGVWDTCIWIKKK